MELQLALSQPRRQSALTIANQCKHGQAIFKSDITHRLPETKNNQKKTYLKNRQQLTKIIQYSSNYI